jgi:hypothetical protein
VRGGAEFRLPADSLSSALGLVQGNQAERERRGGYAEARSTMGGFHLGLGIAALLLAQPMVYLALGAAFALAAFGRILSMLSDSGNTVVNWLYLIVQIVLSALPLAYVFGFI